MTTIKDTLDNLSPEQKRQLMYAFEHMLSQYISLPDGKFIGVHVDKIKNLHVTQKAGVWAIGNEVKETK